MTWQPSQTASAGLAVMVSLALSTGDKNVLVIASFNARKATGSLAFLLTNSGKSSRSTCGSCGALWW
jgi:hypothetical protein